ncbi:uncharacterized protein LOC124616310 [Schistocerca americana]|uniref:uncharacterized protein LOC124616310 n=1 Tax=Schistocerca americana TaxID=7009 RepID=UPI001F4F6029|nr:uncharacterized protein LOC124616310 [Schistocerca americana]
MTYVAALRDDVGRETDAYQNTPTAADRGEPQKDDVALDRLQQSQDALSSVPLAAPSDKALGDVDNTTAHDSDAPHEQLETILTSDSEARPRKQRSPKRRKKRRLTVGNDQSYLADNSEKFTGTDQTTMDTEELPSVDATVASGTAARSTADDAPDTAKELDRRQRATEEATAPAPHDNDGTLGDWSEEPPPWGTDDAGGTAPTHSPCCSAPCPRAVAVTVYCPHLPVLRSSETQDAQSAALSAAPDSPPPAIAGHVSRSRSAAAVSCPLAHSSPSATPGPPPSGSNDSSVDQQREAPTRPPSSQITHEVKADGRLSCAGVSHRR